MVCSACLMLVAGGAAADFLNGDFENGSDSWTWTPLAGWNIDFPSEDGNPDGHVRIQSPFGDSEGTLGVTQEFDCGAESDETCVVTFDYKLEFIDASSMTARIRVTLDGAEVFVSPPSDFIDWTTVAVYPSCGQHSITASLEVDAGNNGWRGSFDNFTATCSPVANEPRSWSTVKSLYR